MPQKTYFPRGAVVAATVLVGLLIVGVVVLAAMAGDEAASPPPPSRTTAAGPVPLVPVDAPAAGGVECKKLLAALPRGLISNGKPLARAEIAEPAPRGAVAWGTADAPVVLRCGLSRPPELTPTSALREISGVRWLPVQGSDATTWYAVDRRVTVALTVPVDSGTGPIQDVSTAIGKTLPAQPVF